MSDAVDAAFAAVPRAGFLPPGSRRRADVDAPVLIGHGQSNSQPRTVAEMLRLLDVRRGQRVLDVGAGSGWTTALLAHLVGPEGVVCAVERVRELATWGSANLADAGCGVVVRVADEHVLGLPEQAPFDRILVSADADVVPAELVSQLADPGILVVPVRGQMTRLVLAEGHEEVTRHGSYRFVPLVTGPPRPG